MTDKLDERIGHPCTQVTDAVTVVVPGIPQRQPRTQHHVRKGKDGKHYAQRFVPKGQPVNTWKATIVMALAHITSKFPDGPIKIDFVFMWPRAKTHRRACPKGRDWYPQGPDWDNVGKAASDAITLAANVWTDDKYVVDARVRKQICADWETPHTVITVSVPDREDLYLDQA